MAAKVRKNPQWSPIYFSIGRNIFLLADSSIFVVVFKRKCGSLISVFRKKRNEDVCHECSRYVWSFPVFQEFNFRKWKASQRLHKRNYGRCTWIKHDSAQAVPIGTAYQLMNLVLYLSAQTFLWHRHFHGLTSAVTLIKSRYDFRCGLWQNCTNAKFEECYKKGI